jgi:hypothetical protein
MVRSLSDERLVVVLLSMDARVGLANVPGMNPQTALGHGHNNGGGNMVMSSFTIRN